MTGGVVEVEEKAAIITKIVVTRAVEAIGDSNDTLDRITTNFAPLLVEGEVDDHTNLRRTMIIGAQEKTDTVAMMGMVMNTTRRGEGGREEEGGMDMVTMTTTVQT